MRIDHEKRKKNRNRMRTSFVLLTVGLLAFGGVASAEENQLFFSEEDGQISLTPGYESESSETAERKGSYDAPEGWTQISASGEDTVTYEYNPGESTEESSTISCSYLDTNYSVLEYEQLRDMLTNNLVYDNVNARISSQVCYTDAKDYLYILTADDSAEVYRDIYFYVVGDNRCFLVEAREYREQAEQMRQADQPTPEETAQELAESFIWNTED